MNTLIVYESRHGTVEECVGLIKSLLPGSVTEHKLDAAVPIPDLDSFDEVIIGGSIRAGSLQHSLKQYCEREKSRLLRKKLGLFVCSLTPPAQAGMYLSQFPTELLAHASVKDCFGGALRYERMNFIERFIMKKISKSPENIDRLDRSKIEAFAKAF